MPTASTSYNELRCALHSFIRTPKPRPRPKAVTCDDRPDASSTVTNEAEGQPSEHAECSDDCAIAFTDQEDAVKEDAHPACIDDCAIAFTDEEDAGKEYAHPAFIDDCAIAFTDEEDAGKGHQRPACIDESEIAWTDQETDNKRKNPRYILFTSIGGPEK